MAWCVGDLFQIGDRRFTNGLMCVEFRLRCVPVSVLGERKCLFDAFNDGYYNWPRETAANEIADSVGVSGPTFLKHLRRGEQKIINSVLKEIQLRNKRL